jgi:uncharacterized protein YkwD
MVRRSQSRQLWVISAAVAASIAAASPRPAAAVSTEEVAAQVRECANQERVKHGLQPLVENHILDQAAQLHARNMARYDFLGHTDPWGRGPGQRVDRFGSADAFYVIAENVAGGQQSVAEACAEWMQSAGHRASILDPIFHSVGGGFAIGQTQLRFYYVQEFGKTNPGGAPPKESRRRGPRGPRVVMRLSEAGDVMTLHLDGRPMAVARRGQTLDVPLGRVRPRARITVEARSVSGELSWGIEQRSNGRSVYSDTRAGAPEPATTVDLATGGTPLIHRVTLDPRGHVLKSFTSRLPKASLWGQAGLVGSFR